MTLTIQIRMDNAAFRDDRFEVIRILKDVSQKLKGRIDLLGSLKPDEYPLMDVNGNACGRVKVTR